MLTMKLGDGTEFTVTGEEARQSIDTFKQVMYDHARIAEIHRLSKDIKTDTAYLVELMPKGMKRIAAMQDRLARALHNHDMKADGETEGNHPWLKLTPPRCAQVQKVYDYLLAHKGNHKLTIARACKATFVPVSGGYGTVGALESYCYSVPITDFI